MNVSPKRLGFVCRVWRHKRRNENIVEIWCYLTLYLLHLVTLYTLLSSVEMLLKCWTSNVNDGLVAAMKQYWSEMSTKYRSTQPITDCQPNTHSKQTQMIHLHRQPQNIWIHFMDDVNEKHKEKTEIHLICSVHKLNRTSTDL